MKKRLLFKLGLGFFVLLGVLAVLPLLLPLDSFLPRIEQEASARLGLPVKLAGLHVQALPTPRVVLTGVQVGAKELEIDRLVLVPALSSLFSSTRVLRLLDMDGVRVQDSLFGKLPAGQGTGGPPPVWLERVKISDFKLSLGGAALSIDSLTFAIEQKDKGLTIQDIKAKLYSGELSGQAKLDWPRQWQLEGKVAAAGLDVGALAKAFAPRQSVSGRLSAETRFTARAVKAEGLADALALDGKFSVAKGVLYNFDFVSAVKSSVSGKVKGGETHFDELHGNAALRGRNLQLRQMVITSGALAVSGKADIQRGGQIAGTFDVELKNTMGFVGVPVAVSGTLMEPQLGLTTGAKIGAAVGTVLAPGVGTSLGASIGRFFEKKTEK